jgi:hypothetical protein
MLSLKEAIEHEKNVSNKRFEKYDRSINYPEISDKYFEQALYHEQIVFWLEELQMYREKHI